MGFKVPKEYFFFHNTLKNMHFVDHSKDNDEMKSRNKLEF